MKTGKTGRLICCVAVCLSTANLYAAVNCRIQSAVQGGSQYLMKSGLDVVMGIAAVVPLDADQKFIRLEVVE